MLQGGLHSMARKHGRQRHCVRACVRAYFAGASTSAEHGIQSGTTLKVCTEPILTVRRLAVKMSVTMQQLSSTYNAGAVVCKGV